ncbi:hypothetical protein MAPG_05715 [Magnaporthiopsis poae ATCC 64411]|uniref:Uncharacterized protein n=1 Tax=Magnaporthiopsis poae (strain ATCC 64411 / 73-15) TaxID=644358 RepID=A0A0C4E049_MAGP6|nr:hypothetical protein MAPG_05715 [Magnaporthiopsis poae ATCC 64411]
MAREGTRSATGNSKPRVFPVVDTAPTITRKKTTKPKKTPAAPATGTKPVAGAKGPKPTGVTKRKATPKLEGGAAKKAVASKAEDKLDKAAKVPTCFYTPYPLIPAPYIVCATEPSLPSTKEIISSKGLDIICVSIST